MYSQITLQPAPNVDIGAGLGKSKTVVQANSPMYNFVHLPGGLVIFDNTGAIVDVYTCQIDIVTPQT